MTFTTCTVAAGGLSKTFTLLLQNSSDEESEGGLDLAVKGGWEMLLEDMEPVKPGKTAQV